MSSEQDPDELARFCAELPQHRALLGPASKERRALMERAVLAAREGRPIGPFLARLGIGTTADELSRDGQLAWRSDPTRVEDPVSVPVAGVYLCPKGSCSRVEQRGAGERLPSCGIHEQALRFVPDD